MGQKRLDIQGLRAIAVLSVLIFHLNKEWLPGGFVGVDIFFAISGYLISSIILSQSERHAFSFKNFYFKRIQRIVPAYFVLLIVVALFAIPLYLYTDIIGFRKSLFWSVLFNSNNYFAGLDTYFGAASSENPLLHTWTLSVEMQFYLFLPIILAFIPKGVLKFVVPALLFASLIYCQIQLNHGNKSEMYFSLSARSGEFMLGVLLSLYQFRIHSRLLTNIMQVLGILLIVFSAAYITEASRFPGFLALVPCIGASLLLIPGNEKGVVNQFLSSKVMVYIGELSYSIYLWHWPILALIRYYINSYHIPIGYLILAIILTVSISILSYKYIENFFRGNTTRPNIIVFGTICIAIVGLGLTVIRLNGRFSKYPERYSSPVGIGQDSHGRFYSKDIIRGDLAAKDTLLLIGDSHAFVLNPFLEKLGLKNGFSYRSVTNDSYPTIPGLSAEDIQERRYQTQYNNLSKLAAQKIASARVIIFTMAWKNNYKSLPAALENMVNHLNQQQVLILITGYPELDANPIRVGRGIIKKKGAIDAIGFKNYSIPDAIVQIVNKNPNKVKILDLSKSEAFATIPYYQDTVMYYDNGHLNAFGSEVFAQFSEKKFMDLVGPYLSANRN